MKTPPDLSRLHALRMDTTAAGYAMDERRGRFETLRDRHTNGAAPRAVSAWQLFQTPDTLARRMVGLAGVQRGHAVLEPSAGLGRILRHILAADPARVVAVDSSPDCVGELRREFPEVGVYERDFLRCEPTREGGAGLLLTPFPGGPAFFDRVVMNPPFHLREDITHVLHARRFLNTGGVLVGLCMNTHHREEALRPLSDVWEVIPAGTFRAEGTNTECILFRIHNI